MHSSLALGDAGRAGLRFSCQICCRCVEARGAKKKERKLFLLAYNADSMATAGLKTHYSICHKQFQVQLHSHDAYAATPLPLFARTGRHVSPSSELSESGLESSCTSLMNPASESCSPESSERGESGRMGRDVFGSSPSTEPRI